MPAAAFRATFSDWRLIKGRKVVSICFEVPLELANEAYDVLGGMPDPGKSVWCAIARLEEPKATDTKPKREKKSWDEMTAAQQAGVLCSDPAFQKFLDEEHWPCPTAEVAAEIVRTKCRVASRRHIDTNEEAKKDWEDLVSDYRTWQRHPEFADAS